MGKPTYIWKNGELVKRNMNGFGLEENKPQEEEVTKHNEPIILADTIITKPPPAPLYVTQKNKPQRTNIRFIF